MREERLIRLRQQCQCSYSYIQDLLASRPHQVWYPNYPATIATNWPIRGWGLITFNTGSWKPDQWLIARDEIETATTGADRIVQEEYWNGVLDEIERLDGNLLPNDINDVWARVAQQVPHWFVLEVTQRMFLSNHQNNMTAWTICVHRLASSGEIERTVDLLAKLPLDIGEQYLRIFAESLSPSLKTTAIRYIEKRFSKSSTVLTIFLERTRYEN